MEISSKFNERCRTKPLAFVSLAHVFTALHFFPLQLWGVEVYTYVFLTSALDEGKLSIPFPSRFTLGDISPEHIAREAWWAPKPV